MYKPEVLYFVTSNHQTYPTWGQCYPPWGQCYSTWGQCYSAVNYSYPYLLKVFMFRKWV